MTEWLSQCAICAILLSNENRLYSKRIYSANGISHSFFPRISAFSRCTKMHLNGMLLIGTEFFKIIVPL